LKSIFEIIDMRTAPIGGGALIGVVVAALGMKVAGSGGGRRESRGRRVRGRVLRSRQRLPVAAQPADRGREGVHGQRIRRHFRRPLRSKHPGGRSIRL